MKRLGMAALAAAALLFSTSVFATAQVSGHVSFSNVQVTVIDLTPDDSLTAGYDVSRRVVDASSNQFGVSYFTFNELEDDGYGGIVHSMSPVHMAVANGMFSARAHASGGIGDASFDIAADGPWGRSSARASGNQVFTIVLRPYSALSISGHATGWITRSETSPEHEYIQYRSGATVMLRHVSVNAPTQLFEQNAELGYDEVHEGFGAGFALNAVNDRDHDIELILQMYGGTEYAGVLQAIPEPSTWLMLAAGLLAIVCRVRPDRRLPPGSATCCRAGSEVVA